jgi:hypothetical protein
MEFSAFLTLILLMWRIGLAPNNASRWKLGFNSVFKGLTSAVDGLLFNVESPAVCVRCRSVAARARLPAVQGNIYLASKGNRAQSIAVGLGNKHTQSFG